MDDTAFRDHLDRLKAASHAKDIAVALGLRGKGKRFFCPSCQPSGGKTPDLDVFDQGFKCYKCGASGDVIDLAVLAGRMTKAEAIAYLEKQTGIIRPGHRRRREYKDKGRVKIVKATPSYAAKNHQEDGDRAMKAGNPPFELYAAFLQDVCRPLYGTPGAEYLVGRGIAANIADRCGVRYCSDLSGLWTLTDRKTIKAAGLSSLYAFQKADLPFLVFPYIREGRPVFIKTRCLLTKEDADRLEVPRFLNTGGKVPCLWNHDAVADAGEILIAEGEIDALSAVGKGFVAVGLPGWSHWKDAWTRDFIGKDVVLVLDADAAGQKGAGDIAKRFIRAGLPCPRQLPLTEGKDLNDVLRDCMKDGKAERMTT